MAIPSGLRYSKDHEWVRVDGDVADVGITDFAQEELGDVVFVQLPEVGEKVQQFMPMGVVESVKAASDLFSPVSGAIIDVNSELVDHPELVNSDPYGRGWMVKVELAGHEQLAQLLTAEEYAQAIAKK